MNNAIEPQITQDLAHLEHTHRNTPAMNYLMSLKRSSRRTQLNALRGVLLYVTPELDTVSDSQAMQFPWERLTYQDTNRIKSALMDAIDDDEIAIATANRWLVALRRVLKESWRLGLMDSESYHRAIDVESIKQPQTVAGRALAPDEIIALLDVCDADANEVGARDAAAITVMVIGGLRRAEVSDLTMANVVVGDDIQLQFKGKGRKVRTVYLANKAAARFRQWLEIRGYDNGFVFVSVDGHLLPTRNQWQPQSIYNMLIRKAQRAGIDRFTPHDLRRTAATSMLRNGLDVVIVSDILGHASVETTKRYDRRGEDDKRQAANAYDLP